MGCPKLLIRGRNNAARVRVESRSFDQGRRKTTLWPIIYQCIVSVGYILTPTIKSSFGANQLRFGFLKALQVYLGLGVPNEKLDCLLLTKI